MFKTITRLHAAQATPSESPRIPALDGWRGVAILFVLLDHATEGAFTGQFHPLLRLGATGVGIFFALSGFLITTRLSKEAERYGAVSLKKFYLRRFFRLIPACCAYLLCIGLLSLAGWIDVTGEQLVASLLFFRNYVPMDVHAAGWYTAHFWSLAVEEHFYLIWPAVLARLGGRAALPTLFALAVAGWRHIDSQFHLTSTGLWFPGRTDIRLDGLLWGCALAILLSKADFREWLSKLFSWRLLALAVILDVVSNLFFGKHNYSSYEPLLLSLIVIWPVLNQHSFLARLLELPVLKWLGRLSYSLYVWQQLWLVFPKVPAPFGELQQMPLNLACVLVSGALSYYAIERPMVRLGHWLTSSGVSKRNRVSVNPERHIARTECAS